MIRSLLIILLIFANATAEHLTKAATSCNSCDLEILTYQNENDQIKLNSIEDENLIMITNEASNDVMRHGRDVVDLNEFVEGSGDYDYTISTKSSTQIARSSVSSDTLAFTTQTQAISTTSVSHNECFSIEDCVNLYGPSVCIKNKCGCIPPTVFYNQTCLKSKTIPIKMKVLIPIDSVCKIFVDSSKVYTSLFENVININAKRNSALNTIYLYSKVTSLKFRGSEAYIKQTCSTKPKNSNLARSEQNDQTLFSNCNDSTSASLCWQSFDVDFTLHLIDRNNYDAEEDSPYSEQRKYKIMILLFLSVKLENSFAIFNLNDNKSHNSKQIVIIDIKSLSDICYETRKQLGNGEEKNSSITELLQVQQLSDECIENARREAINEELKLVQPSFSNRCNLDSNTCYFMNRICRDSYYGPICECKTDFYAPNDIINTECLPLEDFCSRDCLNNGQCIRLSNNEEKCYCVGLYFGDNCQFNSLILFIVAAVLLFLSSISSIFSWITWCVYKRHRLKDEKIHRRQLETPFCYDDFSINLNHFARASQLISNSLELQNKMMTSKIKPHETLSSISSTNLSNHLHNATTSSSKNFSNSKAPVSDEYESIFYF